jgi:hypothetical protein
MSLCLPSTRSGHLRNCRVARIFSDAEVEPQGQSGMAYSDTFRRRLLFASAIALLLIAAVTMIWGQHNFVIRCAGLAAIFGSLQLLRAARSVGQFSSTAAASRTSPPTAAMWLVGVALAVAQGLTFYLLYSDAVDGYKQVWPVYAFAATAIICAIFFAALFTRRQR